MASDKRPRSGTDYAREVADAIIEQLRQGAAPWTRPWAPGQGRLMPHNPSTGNDYHGANALWLYVQAERRGYNDTRWLTFRQAQELGASIRKGEHGTRIQYWAWSGREPVLDEKGQPKRDEKGEVIRQVVKYQRPRVFTAVVFNAVQIDGLPREEVRSALPDWERHARAEAILKASGAAIHQVDGNRAFYNLIKDEITLPLQSQFPSADTYYGTALHELSHWTGHPSRLAREGLDGPFGSESYAREELRAEIASLMLGNQLGIGHDPKRHASYVQSWIRVLQEDPREIFRAAGDADRITNFVLSLTQEKTNAQEERAEIAPVEQIPPTMAFASERVALAVPYMEKDAAKAAGACWDRKARSWFAPASADLALLARWMPSPHQLAVQEPQAELAEALRAAGLKLAAEPAMDGALHRVSVEGDKPGQRSGAYVGHLDGHPAGFIENHKTGFKTNWKSSVIASSISVIDRKRLEQEAAQHRTDRDWHLAKEHERVARESTLRLEKAEVRQSHPYLEAKGLRTLPEEGFPVDEKGNLLLPLKDIRGNVWSLQAISPDGRKNFAKGGEVTGHFFPLGDLRKADRIIIAEGYATARTVLDLHGQRGNGDRSAPISEAVVAFHASNLAPVAKVLRAAYPKTPIYIAADNDHELEAKGKPNVGRQKAEEAAREVNGHMLLPDFRGLAGSDWNDLALVAGREAAATQLKATIGAAEFEITAQKTARGRRQAAISLNARSSEELEQ